MRREASGGLVGLMGKAATNIEGRLAIRLAVADGAVRWVEISSSRPLQTPRIFHGKTVTELLTTLPLLYSVCGTAQACAAVNACEQALGQAPDPVAATARQRLVGLETAKEHLWRILLDWPDLLGQSQDSAGVGELLQLVKGYRDASYPNGRPFLPGSRPAAEVDTAGMVKQLSRLLEMRVFAMPPEKWCELENESALADWAARGETPAAAMLEHLQRQGWSGLGSSDVTGLPALDGRVLQARLTSPDEERFIASPELEGACYETSPLTRVAPTPLLSSLRAEQGNGLLTRFVARLLELAMLPRQLGLAETPEADQVAGLPAGTGIAQVEAARGRLVHRVVLEDERVAAYQIVAPTEWNFHPRGALARGLQGLAVKSEAELRQQAVLLINAIDPCVGYDLQIENG
ncbi:MAG: nickel-dependent hydrogenase large subunit [Sedimenticola sp.]|nr:nickel-dependent hydrogenase large subunit [Sedimenticola sp.]